MLANIVVGGIFALIMFFAAKKAFSDMKKGKCSGCSSCGSKDTCSISEISDIKPL